jgi:hypothetical protein
MIGSAGNTVTVSKGSSALHYYLGDRSACTRIDSREAFSYVVFPKVGTYRVRLIAGAYDPSTGRCTAHDSKPVTVEVSPPSGTAARLSALLPYAATAGGAALLILAARAP